MKLKKLGAFAATGAMALALALTGCGSSNATSGSDAGSSSSDDAKVEKVDGSKEYALVKDGTLTVGTSAEYAPFEYKDDNGDYQGFDLELIKAIGDKLGLDVEYVNNDFDTLVPGVASILPPGGGVGGIVVPPSDGEGTPTTVKTREFEWRRRSFRDRTELQGD